jgi:hypothetical protein
VKQKLTCLSSEGNVKELNDLDFSFELADMNPYTKKLCLNVDKECSLGCPGINEEDSSKVGASYSTAPKVKLLDSARETALTSSNDSDVGNMQDTVIELLSSDDESITTVSDEIEIERCCEEMDGVRSPEMCDLITYPLDSDDSVADEYVKNMEFTTTDSEQNHRKMPHHSNTKYPVIELSSDEESIILLSNESEIEICCEEEDGDESKINSTASNPVIMDCTASEPEAVSSGSESAVLKSCDCSKPLIMNNFNGNLECINSKSVMDNIPNKESGFVCCARKNSCITSNPYKKLLSSDISGRVMVVDNTQSSSEYCKTSEDAGGLAEEPLIVDASDREPLVIDRPVAESVGFNECDRKTVIVDSLEGEPMIVTELDEDSLVTDILDRKLVVSGNNEVEPLVERTITASCRINGSDNIDNVDLNNKGICQGIIKTNMQILGDNIGQYDKDTNKNTSAVERALEEKVNSDLLIASCKAVLYRHHDSVATRMGLNWVPACCLDPYSCTQRHKSALVSGEL